MRKNFCVEYHNKSQKYKNILIIQNAICFGVFFYVYVRYIYIMLCLMIWILLVCTIFSYFIYVVFISSET